MQAHTVVVGYGTKGRSAVRALLGDGYPRDRIVVVDGDPGVVAEANGSDEADRLLADDRLVVVRDTGRPHRD